MEPSKRIQTAVVVAPEDLAPAYTNRAGLLVILGMQNAAVTTKQCAIRRLCLQGGLVRYPLLKGGVFKISGIQPAMDQMAKGDTGERTP